MSSMVFRGGLGAELAGGVTLATNLSINEEMRCSPSLLRKVVEMLSATASMGISASREV